MQRPVVCKYVVLILKYINLRRKRKWVCFVISVRKQPEERAVQ